MSQDDITSMKVDDVMQSERCTMNSKQTYIMILKHDKRKINKV